MVIDTYLIIEYNRIYDQISFFGWIYYQRNILVKYWFWYSMEMEKKNWWFV